jgi:DNA-binding SARP family transcriptional activator
MDGLRVCLFGKLDVKRGDQGTVDLCARKAQELFCYLLLHRDRPRTREALAAVLWNDCSPAQSKKHLRQTLWQLQTAIRLPTEPHHAPVLTVESEWVYIDPRNNLWLDVAEFEQAFTLTKGTPGRQLDAQNVQGLQNAVELYRGDLLEDWYQDWCLFERERLQNMYLAMLDKLIDYSEANELYEAGLTYGALILRHDRARERTHRRLMRLHYLSRNRTAALRQYEQCVAALKEELGVRPAKSTMALYEQIRADQLEVLPIFAPVTTEPTTETTATMLYDLLTHIEQIQQILTHTRSQIQQQIQAVEPTPVDQR